MFQNIKHLRKALFSQALNNNIPASDYAYIEPATLIKMGMKQNTLELFNSVKDRLKYCQYDSTFEYNKLITFVTNSHRKEYIDRSSFDSVIANQFSDNITNSHMIWLSYITSQQQEYNQYLRNLESVWYKNIIYLNLMQIYTILTFYSKFNQLLQEKTLYHMLKIVHKHSEGSPELIYHILRLIERQNQLFKGDPLFLEAMNNNQPKINNIVKRAQITAHFSLFLDYPIEDLQFISNGIKNQKYQFTSQQMKNILTLIMNCLIANPQFDPKQLIQLIGEITVLFDQNNTISNKYQLAILNKVANEDYDISSQEPKIELLQLIDLDYTVKSRSVMKSTEASENLKSFIQKHVLKTLPKRKIFCTDFDHILPIIRQFQQNKEYSYLLTPFREFLQVYSFLY